MITTTDSIAVSIPEGTIQSFMIYQVIISNVCFNSRGYNSEKAAQKVEGTSDEFQFQRVQFRVAVIDKSRTIFCVSIPEGTIQRPTTNISISLVISALGLIRMMILIEYSRQALIR